MGLAYSAPPDHDKVDLHRAKDTWTPVTTCPGVGEGWMRPWQLIGYQRYVCDPRVCSTEQLLPSALRRCKLVVEQRVAAYRPLKGIPSKYY